MNKLIPVAIITLLAGASAYFISDAITLQPATQQPPPYELPVPSVPIETKLLFTGDIMLSRTVNNKINQANSYDLPFTSVAEVIKNADISFGNLESPFTDLPEEIKRNLVFKAEPTAITGLTNAGFDILSTANNHAFDQGRHGILYTVDWLNKHGIKPVGTSLDCHAGQIIEANGMKFGFLAYSYAAHNDGGRTPDPLVCDWNDQPKMATDIAALKSQSDFVIVSSHFGKEYVREPSEIDSIRARAAIDAGADLLIGHHPHWVQTIEEYKGKYIFYSLGNFVFDQMWSQDTRQGLAVQVLFKDKTLDTITLLPVVIDNYCCPRWANDTETKSILTSINRLVQTPILATQGRTKADWIEALK